MCAALEKCLSVTGDNIKVRLRWFGADLVKVQYLCHLSWDLNLLYIKLKLIFSSIMQCK